MNTLSSFFRSDIKTLYFQVPEETTPKLEYSIFREKVFFISGGFVLINAVRRFILLKSDDWVVPILEAVFGVFLCHVGFQLKEARELPSLEVALTSKLEKKTIRSSSPLLELNLKLGKEIVDYVRKEVPISSNYHLTPITIEEYYKRSVLLDSIRDRIRNYDFSLSAKIIKKGGIGNCGELAIVGYQYAKEKNIPIQRVTINGGDHTFLGIGLPSSFSDRSSWGEEVVICDPWNRGVYPAIFLESYLKSFVMCDEIDGEIVSIVESFNPNIHTLSLMEDPLEIV